MNIKGFKRMLFGEKMPDKDDPQYKERYEREVQAGHKFAKATRIDQAAAKVQGFANAHRTLFLVIVFTFVIGAFAWNAYRLVTVYRHSPASFSIACTLSKSAWPVPQDSGSMPTSM